MFQSEKGNWTTKYTKHTKGKDPQRPDFHPKKVSGLVSRSLWFFVRFESSVSWFALPDLVPLAPNLFSPFCDPSRQLLLKGRLPGIKKYFTSPRHLSHFVS